VASATSKQYNADHYMNYCKLHLHRSPIVWTFTIHLINHQL